MGGLIGKGLKNIENPPNQFSPVGPKPPFTEIYDQDYFSGSQVSIYVGDIWIDEVTSLSYSCQQSKTPIYGYASQLFDAVAAGQVIVQGNFTINYKEQGYLHAVLKRYKKMSGQTPISAKKIPADTQGNKGQSGGNSNYSGGEVGDHTKVTHQTIESFQSIDQLLSGALGQNERQERYLSIAGYATFDVNSPKDKAFADLVENFENQVWGDGAPPVHNNQIRRIDAAEYDDFDIYVVFGNYMNDRSNHTCQKIEGVRLLSQGKQIIVGGAPIQEEYSFIARTVV